jgi:hypothetical protein
MFPTITKQCSQWARLACFSTELARLERVMLGFSAAYTHRLDIGKIMGDWADHGS